MKFDKLFTVTIFERFENSKIVGIEYLPSRVTKNTESTLGITIKSTKERGVV